MEEFIPGVKIKILGIGTAGCKILDRMIAEGLEGVDFVAINTDASSLAESLANKKINIGHNLTKGLGAGGNIEIGRKAAEESEHEIKEMLQDTNMVFVTCGMSGGTGSGATPVIANIAKKMGILTIAIVTTPFSFELHDRPGRRFNVEEGLKKIKEAVDAFIVIPNDKIFKVIDKKTTFKQAFAIIDNILFLSVQGISDLIINPGNIDIDFADVKNIMIDSGSRSIGIGYGTGDNKTINATRNAIENFGLYSNLSKVKNIILSVTGGDDTTIEEAREAATILEEIIDPNTNFLWGMPWYENMKDEVKVIIIATGLEAE
ncbi:MAG: cell division protein FtsZ [candidate division SR1 bacterium]|nr:cell division protein FtsZ [candidate division SR1 bacterium]